MIVGIDRRSRYYPLVVGKLYENWISDTNMKWHFVPFLCLRESSYTEWVKEMIDSGLSLEQIRQCNLPDDALYYEVSID